MSRTLKFTIYHGMAASLAIHSALALPFVVRGLMPQPDELPPTLVIELKGVVADSQAEQKILQQTAEAVKQNEADKPKPAEAPPVNQDAPDDSPLEEKDASTPLPTPTRAQTEAKPMVNPGAANVPGVAERQTAQIIKTDRDVEANRLREYVKLLTKKVQANLVYPDEGRKAGLQGAVTVSFTILQTGQISQDSLTIVVGSGQPKLDASALATVRASAPFEQPPREMTVAIAVGFVRKR